MTKDLFWSLIEARVSQDEGDSLEPLVNDLAARPLEDIVAFDGIFRQLHRDSYSWELWVRPA